MSNIDIKHIVLTAKPGQKLVIEIRNEVLGRHYPLLSLEEILEIICSITSLSPRHIKASDRRNKVKFIRHLFCYIAHEYYEYNLSEIGRYLDRNHATVINSLKVIKTTRGYHTFLDNLIHSLQNKFPFTI